MATSFPFVLATTLAGLALGVVSIDGAGAKTGEWPYYSADNLRPNARPRSNQQDNVSMPRGVAAPQADPALLRRIRAFVCRTAIPRRRSWSTACSMFPMASVWLKRSRDGPDAVDAEAAGACAGRSAGRRRPLGRRLLEPGRGVAGLQHARPVSVCARCEERRADRRLW